LFLKTVATQRQEKSTDFAGTFATLHGPRAALRKGRVAGAISGMRRPSFRKIVRPWDR
jgi:hypothetical protein